MRKLQITSFSTPIILHYEGERGSPGLIEFGIGSSVNGESQIVNLQMYVPKSEGSGIVRHVSIFSWSNEEEECSNDHIGGGSQTFLLAGRCCAI